jgi:hypothetical protein
LYSLRAKINTLEEYIYILQTWQMFTH